MAKHSDHETQSPFSVLESTREFIARHIGPSETEQAAMLKSMGLRSLDDLLDQTIPAQIRLTRELDLPQSSSESETLQAARAFAQQNRIYRSMIGQGYHGTLTPGVILRNVLENPGWYTAYTPYQAEVSQGRLEALLNFQTMVGDLTGLPIANASLLDEGTAAAEAMTLCHGQSAKKDANTILVASDVHPQTLEVISRRAEAVGIRVETSLPEKMQMRSDVFAILLQYPNTHGGVVDHAGLCTAARAAKVLTIAATDLLALTLLKPPGEWGADVVIGSSQRFGVPMGFGGPHAAFLATRDEFKRSIPGRLIGVSIDSAERPALRLALQTREQHIRREKATSNICTAQVLLAVMASFYAIYHGPHGLRQIAQRVSRLAHALRSTLSASGLDTGDGILFDTVAVSLTVDQAKAVHEAARRERINLRAISPTRVGVSFDETHGREDLRTLLRIFSAAVGSSSMAQIDVDRLLDTTALSFAGPGVREWAQRSSSYLNHPVFNRYHSETEMLRYITSLQAKDLTLAHSMIALGSCTMKLNATTEMLPVTWPEFSQLHPLAPADQAQGYVGLIRELEGWLREITGFAAISLQPNAGSAGEYAGLLAIRDYHRSRGEEHRTVCLIPSSAHGTNPASAVMAGMKVVVVKCDEAGNVDLADLEAKAEQAKDNLAALMVTYPSTHGVFEEGIKDACRIIHARGGQVYMDGANFNALVGHCRPGDFGPDVCHLNLHKTFCIPHGGGGPGVGPIGVREHLAPFLPGHKLGHAYGLRGQNGESTAVSSAPFGSASILPISWAYIKMMGRDGLKQATSVAILNANYIAHRLAPHFPVLYRGKNGYVAHECIIDLRPTKASCGVDVEDVAKRLIDYGFHAPTMSWPVVGTLMIEPTESESKAELDRFCDAMISIRQEIARVEKGEWERDLNPLKMAPHPVEDLLSDRWDRPYSRQVAAYPTSESRLRKFWPSVSRVNNVHGDKNLVCSCLPIEAYQSDQK